MVLLVHFQRELLVCSVCRLKNEQGERLKFKDLDGKLLSFNTTARPYRRCLVFQARYALKQAETDGRITEEHLARMQPYLLSMSPQASNLQVKDGTVSVEHLHSARMEPACP